MKGLTLVLIGNRFDRGVFLKAGQHPDFHFEQASQLSELSKHYPDAQALIVRSGTTIDSDLLDKLPKLKLVVTATAGFDHIDLMACEKKGVKCFHTPHAQKVAAAEMTILLMLASLRKLPQAFNQIQRGDWNRSLLLGEQLFGKTLGIIGLGRVGTEVAKRAYALGLKVTAYDPHITEAPEFVTMMGFEEMMRSLDILSIHVPKTGRTRHMIKKETLSWLHSEALLVNMSRGDVINEDDLIDHLMENPESRAALDVFAREPLSTDSPLMKLNNVVMSPHVGASTQGAIQESSQQAMDCVFTFFNGGEPGAEALPPKAPWWGE